MKEKSCPSRKSPRLSHSNQAVGCDSVTPRVTISGPEEISRWGKTNFPITGQVVKVTSTALSV